MKIIENIMQGSDSWHAHRASSRNASEAPVIMGESSFMSRQELLRQKATGYTPEVDAAKQRLFDAGHAAEHAARLIFETEVGEDFFTVVATTDDGYLSASMDGLNMAGDTVFEHKLFNADLAEAVRNSDLPPMYYWQLEQQLLVSGAEKAIFVCSDGTRNSWEQMEYRPVPGRAEKLIAAWKQFDEDLANYQHVEVAQPAIASSIKDLPALTVQIVGSVVASNLEEWKSVVTYRIESINENLQDDQDFADADAMTKFLADGEKSLDLVKANAQAQAQPIDALFRAIDEIKNSMRAKRLNLEKMVKARKENIRGEIVQEGKNALAQHIAGLNKRIGRPLMQPIDADFFGAIKGKKTVSSLRDSVATELASAKVKANDMADRITANLATLEEIGKDYPALFSDLVHIVAKETDDFTALVKTRIADHKEAEAKRIAAEQEKQQAEQAQPVPQQITQAQAIEDGKPAVERSVVAAPVAAPAVSQQQAQYDTAWKIAGVVAEMTEQERVLVLHYCNRVIEQRQAAE